MSNVDEKVVQRISELIEKGKKAKAAYITSPPNVIGGGHLDYALFNAWKSASENLITKIVGRDSSYYLNFVEQTQKARPSCAESGTGILQAFKEDLENGLLVDIKQLAIAEVFTDFLEIVQHLLNSNYKDPAASLIGAVLENGLKDIAIKNSISFSKNDGIDDINKKLAIGAIYNALVQKQVDLWRTIRNSADHGKFNDYTLEDIKNMKVGVEDFLTNNL